MNTTTAGRQAETFVCNHVSEVGYKIIAQNWRTRFCEIDIVAKKGKVVYFCEVKFRRRSAQGEGLEYIIDTKLRQLRLAAEFWCKDNDWSGDYRICAASVSQKSEGLSLDDLLEIDF